MKDFIFESIKMALRTMRLNKMRTLLSLLGVMIGVASLVTILSLGVSVSDNMIKNFQEGGIDIITINPRRTRNSNEIFNDEFTAELEREFDSIDKVIVTSSQSLVLRYLDETYTAPVIGTYSTFGDFYSVKFDSGAWWLLESNISSEQVCVIGREVADNLFPSIDPVGQYIKVYSRNGSKNYRVSGVLSKKDATSSVSFDTSIFIPYNTYVDRVQRSKIVGSYIIRIKAGYNVSSEADKIDEYLQSLVSEDGFMLFSLSSLREMISQQMSTITIFLSSIAAISLVVGGIGIMNIMLVSVAERTREIGILKALGASKKAILVQFLIESITLTLCGGVLGVLFGIIVAICVALSQAWTIGISFSSIIVGVVFSLTVGIFFGVYPASKAAKLNPIDALNRE